MQKLFGKKKEVKSELRQDIYPGVVDTLPQHYHEFIFGEPVRSIGTTFCIWQNEPDKNWKTGEIKFPSDDYIDGSSDLLQLLDENPLTYKMWAEEYYDELFKSYELKLTFVEDIYNGVRITKKIALAINPDFEDYDKLKADLESIGYDNY